MHECRTAEERAELRAKKELVRRANNLLHANGMKLDEIVEAYTDLYS
jgi:hypothetical protein